MLKFLISVGVVLGGIIGLVAIGIGLFFMSTPRPNNLRECLTTSLYKVRLCPTEAGYMKLKDISAHARNAVLVSEDAAFFDHQGIDWHEMQESMHTNWEKGGWARGGSTITQQLAKNVYLSSEKSLLRKLREAIIAVQMEKMYSKQEILEKYLNVVQFGPEVFGISKAARYYFGKSASSLTPAESAFLAMLLPSPEKYSVSFRKKQLTKYARSQTIEIINRLARFKRISADEHVAALAQLEALFGSPASDLAEPVLAIPAEDNVAPPGEPNSEILDELETLSPQDSSEPTE